MRDPFRELGLDRNADERAIKQAYAKRLRAVRPDDDPTGFQQLHDAYRRALGFCKSRGTAAPVGFAATSSVFAATWTKSPSISTSFGTTPPPHHTHEDGKSGVEQSDKPAPRVPETPHHSNAAWCEIPKPTDEAFNPVGFVAGYRTAAASGDDSALAAWLSSNPMLWRLQTKHAAARFLLQALSADPVAMPRRCFEATSRFFGYDDALSGVNALMLARLQQRCMSEWETRPENLDNLARHLYGTSKSNFVRELRKLCERSRRSLRWPEILLLSFRPTRVRHASRFITLLCGGNVGDLPRDFDRPRARFWMEATDRKINRARLTIFGIRSVVSILAVPLFPFLVFAVNGELDANPSWRLIGGVALAVAGLVSAFWLLVLAAWLSGKYDRIAARSRWGKWVSISFTPALCTVSIAAAQWLDPAVGTLIAIVAMWIAVMRFRTRHRFKIDMGARIGLFIGAGFVANLFGYMTKGLDHLELIPPMIIGFFALTAWAIDMKKTYLPRAARR